MKNAYVFDVWETLADTPEWQDMLKKDPELWALNEKAKKNDVPSKREVVKRFDQAVQGGKLRIVEVPEARSILGNVYHLDRKSTLSEPRQEKEGYIIIANLAQMRELTR